MSPEDRKGAAGGVPSIISPDLEIVGNLKSSGEIQIDGTVKGDIHGHLLAVGEQGKVDGSTVGDTVQISGTVNGRVEAKTVYLAKSAKVAADITQERLAACTSIRTIRARRIERVCYHPPFDLAVRQVHSEFP